MSVTYIYSVDSAGDLTSAGTSSTSGNTLSTNELLWEIGKHTSELQSP